MWSTNFQEGPLSQPLLKTLRYTYPLLFALAALNAAAAAILGDLGGVSTALCLCVCAAGLLVEVKEQQYLLLGQRILARMATQPVISTVQAARAVSCSIRVAEIVFDRLTADGLVACRELHVGLRMYTLVD